MLLLYIDTAYEDNERSIISRSLRSFSTILLLEGLALEAGKNIAFIAVSLTEGDRQCSNKQQKKQLRFYSQQSTNHKTNIKY
jgi:hypothetical protein